MAWGRRCDLGCASWPDDKRYKTCPVCGETTSRFSNLHPMTQSEANHMEFIAFYDEWDQNHDPGRLDPRFLSDPAP